ncbi:MAG: 4-phosphoerythronate dehydrogenase [Breznakibacter sp.]
MPDNSLPKIVCDDKIPFLRGTLEPYAKVEYHAGSKITADTVRDASAVVTRTRTKCNQALLQGSSVRFIGTATIGFDHIDTQWAEANGIEWTNAPGCNSGSVKQYMAAALALLVEEKGMTLNGKTIGIVGVGNVGTKVEQVAKAFGMEVLLCDPPRKRREGGDFVDFDQIAAQSDFITFHTPLNRTGGDKTLHFFNPDVLPKLRPGVTVFNTSRGEIIDTRALKTAIDKGIVGNAIIDVWEDEPFIDLELLGKAFVATPHIAGYSLDGKALGTAMVVRALSKKFGFPLVDWFPASIPRPGNPGIHIDVAGLTDEQALAKVILHTYPLRRDDNTLRRSVETFEDQRGNYPVRREFGAYEALVLNGSEGLDRTIKGLGFIV